MQEEQDDPTFVQVAPQLSAPVVVSPQPGVAALQLPFEVQEHAPLETEQDPPQAMVPKLVCPQDEGMGALQVFEVTLPPQVPQES